MHDLSCMGDDAKKRQRQCCTNQDLSRHSCHLARQADRSASARLSWGSPLSKRRLNFNCRRDANAFEAFTIDLHVIDRQQ